MNVACWTAWVILAFGCVRFGFYLVLKLME